MVQKIIDKGGEIQKRQIHRRQETKSKFYRLFRSLFFFFLFAKGVKLTHSSISKNRSLKIEDIACKNSGKVNEVLQFCLVHQCASDVNQWLTETKVFHPHHIACVKEKCTDVSGDFESSFLHVVYLPTNEKILLMVTLLFEKMKIIIQWNKTKSQNNKRTKLSWIFSRLSIQVYLLIINAAISVDGIES